MKKLSIVLILAIIAILVFTMKGPYNNMVDLNSEVELKWANVEAQYQRRFDMVENLVKTVNASAGFEKSTLVEVTEARASGLNALKGTNGGRDLSGMNNAKGLLAVGGTRGMMMGYSEKYPELKSVALFSDVMTQLEGTENRIAKAREDFNAEVKVYNAYIDKFPGVMYAGMFGFDERDFFGSSTGADEGIDVGGKKFGE